MYKGHVENLFVINKFRINQNMGYLHLCMAVVRHVQACAMKTSDKMAPRERAEGALANLFRINKLRMDQNMGYLHLCMAVARVVS